jgi:hypothetical protein
MHTTPALSLAEKQYFNPRWWPSIGTPTCAAPNFAGSGIAGCNVQSDTYMLTSFGITQDIRCGGPKHIHSIFTIHHHFTHNIHTFSQHSLFKIHHIHYISQKKFSHHIPITFHSSKHLHPNFYYSSHHISTTFPTKHLHTIFTIHSTPFHPSKQPYQFCIWVCRRRTH